MSENPAELPLHLDIDVPADKAVGCYADFVSVWHTKDVFVLDFAALVASPTHGEGPNGEPMSVAKSIITSRVRVPPGQVCEVMKALEAQLTAWEQESGARPS